MLPMPCAIISPLQHFLEYMFLSLHKHPLDAPLGDDLLGI